jgi:cytochrome c biogenesis protein CcmG, thiol:disulfide interchange protein DsbE
MPIAPATRWRWLLVPLLAVPLGWLLFTGLGRDPRLIPSPLVGQPLPALSGPTLDGGIFDSTMLDGRPAVVNVWASWCDPCVDEHPLLLDLERQHGDELAVVGLLYQDGPDQATRFLERYGDGGWPDLTDVDGSMALDLGVTGPPETFFVDVDGIVRYRHVGPLTADVLAEQLPRLGIRP